jgi:hypothetical protein
VQGGEEADKPTEGDLGAVGELDEAHELVHDPEGGLRCGPARGRDVGGRQDGEPAPGRGMARSAGGGAGLRVSEQVLLTEPRAVGCERSAATAPLP